MKKLVLFFMIVGLVVLGTTVSVAVNHRTEKKVEAVAKASNADSTNYVPSYTDSNADSEAVDSDSTGVVNNDADVDEASHNLTLDEGGFDAHFVLAIIAIISAFVLPLLIIFLIFFFRYKNRKAKYRLAEKALETGKPLPNDVFTAEERNKYQTKNPAYDSSMRDKGIQTTFTGAGLFIFFWAVTGRFSIGCIGLLVMFYGAGLWVSSTERKNEAKRRGYFHQNDDHTYSGTSSPTTNFEQSKEAAPEQEQNDEHEPKMSEDNVVPPVETSETEDTTAEK